MYKINRTDSRTTKWNLFFNYTSIFYNIIIAIALVPLYLKYIPSNIFGVWLATGNIITWMTLLDPGLGATMQYKIAYSLGQGKKNEIGNLIGNSFCISLFFLFVLSFGAFFLQKNIFSWLNITSIGDSNFMLALALTSVSTILMVFSFNIQGINLGLQSSVGVGLVFTLMNICGIISTIYFLKSEFGLLAFGYSGIIRSLIYLFGNFIYMILRLHSEKVTVSIDFKGIKELFNLFSISFVGKITGTLQGRMFEFLIAKYVSYTSVTSFKMSLSAPENSKILMIRPTVAVTPIISKLYGSGDYIKIKNNFRKIFLFFIWISGFLLTAFILFNKNFIDLWIGKKFYIGSQINILICILVIVSSFSEILAHLVWSLGEIKKNNIATFLQFLIFLPCGIYASINFGITGLLTSSISSYLLVTIWYFLFIIYDKLNYKLNNIYTPLKEIIINLLIFVSIFYFFNSPIINNWKDFILICSFFIIIYITLLFIISKNFRNIVLSLIKRKKLFS